MTQPAPALPARSDQAPSPGTGTDRRSGSEGPPRPRAAEDRRPGVRLYLRLCRVVDLWVAVGVLLVAFLVTNIGRMPLGLAEFLAMRLTVKNLLLLIGFALAWRLVCTTCGLYDWSRLESAGREGRRVLVAAAIGGATAFVFPAISVTGAFQVRTVLLSMVGIAAGMLGLRRALRAVLEVGLEGPRNLIIVGSGPRALKLAAELAPSGADARMLGFVDVGTTPFEPAAQDRYLGNLADLDRILLGNPVSEVYLALPMRSRYEEIQRAISVCENTGVPVKWLADVFESARGKRSYDDRDSSGVIHISRAPDGQLLVVKRVADVIGAGLGLLLALPVLLLAALAIKLASPGPVLFAQERYGLNRRRFRMLKLRTMVSGAEARQAELEDLNEASGPVFKISRDPRITPVGRLLRRTSIDELPQLVNVLRGEMSLVGPRPLPLRDVHRFTEPALVRRFSVRPGITGLWQVNGRSELPYDRWVELDLRYVDEWSLGLDFRIMLQTVPAVVRGTGAS